MKCMLSVVLALAAGMWGCAAPSLHPLYAPDSLTQDSGLVGEWATEGSMVTRVVVDEGSAGKYTGALTVRHNGELKTDLALEVCLTDIGPDQYVDLFLASSDRDKLAGRYGFLALPVHQFMMIQREGDELRVSAFNADWLRDAGARHAFACEVLPVGGSQIAVVTAESGTLREFLKRHAHDPGALAAPMVFHRVGQGGAASERGAKR